MQPKTSKKKVEDIISKYTANQTKGSAVAIQDLVKKTKQVGSRAERDIKKIKKI